MSDLYASLPQAFFDLASRKPEAIAYSQPLIDKQDSGRRRRRREVTFREVKERVQKIAAYLKDHGFQRGEKAAIISSTRPEWMEADLAVLSAGGIVVSLYPTLVSDEIGYLLYDSDARFVFAENEEQLAKLFELMSRECLIPAVENRPATSVELKFTKIITFEKTKPHALVASLDEVLYERPAELPQALYSLSLDDVANIVYTSGTTGPPKGVLQTHGNHLANIRQARQAGMCRPDSALALFLPLAHSFAKLMGYAGFTSGVRLEFPAVADRSSSRPVLESIMRDLREGKAEIVPLVPRILEKMREAVIKRSRERGLGNFILRLTLWAARKRYKALKKREPVSLTVGAAFWLTRYWRREIKANLFGRRFRYAISGGAKLAAHVQEFFIALGIEVLEGYGSTETCVATNVNRSGAIKIGTVGPVLAPDIEMKIAPDGEILFRGPNVAVGYHNRPQAGKEAWDKEGWFHSGDLGAVDSEGYLTITGRKKELIITAGGKKVAPENIEQRLVCSDLISQAMLVGEGRPYCVALVTLRKAALKTWAEMHAENITGDFNQNKALVNAVWQEVQRVNKHLSSYEGVKKILILPEEFSIENGMLTPTLKVRRQEVLKRYGSLINALYSSQY